MDFARTLSLKNIRRKPARTVALILLSAFLAFTIFAGSITVLSLRNGLTSYETRLGADIVVVPNEARSHGTIDSILLEGIPGYFYMDAENLEKIRSMDGVETATPQFYLSTVSSGCCSAKVQIIGFDPETDFSIQPWIRESYSGEIGQRDIIVGSNITVPKNKTLKFYNVDCNVVGKLDETGTGLDNAVYANMDTVKEMMRASVIEGYDYFKGISVEDAISSVMVKVENGYDIDSVNNDINIHVRKVEATKSKSMISAIASGLANVSGVIGGLTIIIWVLAVIVLIIAYSMIVHERTKELAVLRVMGASRKMLSGLLRTESAIMSVVGSIIGVALASAIVFPFSTLIKNKLDLPYLLPAGLTIALLLLGTIIITVLAGALTAGLSAGKIVKNDTGLILREGA